MLGRNLERRFEVTAQEIPYKDNTFLVIVMIGISEKLGSFLTHLGLNQDSVRHGITK